MPERNQPVGFKSPSFASDHIIKVRKSAGSHFGLLCEAQAYPGRPLPINRKQKVFPNGTLIIENVERQSDQATYTCVAKTAQGYSSRGTLEVQVMDTSRDVSVVTPSRKLSVLSIDSVTFEHVGNYSCLANNTAARSSYTASLLFTCKYEGNPVKTISWMKDGKPVPDHNEPVFRIDSVRKEDKGMYQCVIRNEQESAQASGELKLGGRFDPPVIKESFSDETLNPGPNYYFKCIASGNPTPEISWYLDGKKLVNAERFVFWPVAVISQYYEAQVYDVFVIKGNAAVFKCNLPSFVSDHLDVVSWADTDGGQYQIDNQDFDGKYLVLPSGELHIRDVGPEDGYKSYQCRTKHRLTGETRLSATKGRLVITGKNLLS
ncbi:Down syndrome cell adhesion molecule-like protein Dscam2 [Diaphorina citri]|uniref:Down syndrome cell adhesion molecule-like protein Dscam2 n=1 Tax=Diaphorina citri TaxID=121845 RepID=A0A3Q0J374_DIACI|nr:Down syndrome cell adhesion molecule-like protein Dscam2 [Diaphorina citri]